MRKGVCGFMTISEAKKGGLKIHSRRKKNKSRIKKKNKKKRNMIYKTTQKKYNDIKTNQLKNKKNVTFTPTVAMLIRTCQIT